jgi:hypothetical protein
MSEINETRLLMAELLLIWFVLCFVFGWCWYRFIEKTKEPKNDTKNNGIHKEKLW